MPGPNDVNLKIDAELLKRLPDLAELIFSDPIRVASSTATVPAITAVNSVKPAATSVAIHAKGVVIVDGPLVVRGGVSAVQITGEAGAEISAMHSEIAALRAELDAVKRFLRDTSKLYGAYTSGYFA